MRTSKPNKPAHLKLIIVLRHLTHVAGSVKASSEATLADLRFVTHTCMHSSGLRPVLYDGSNIAFTAIWFFLMELMVAVAMVRAAVSQFEPGLQGDLLLAGCSVGV